MKRLFLFFFLFEYTVAQAQTVLDSLIVEKVNAYRIENGLIPLKWDNCLKTFSNQHLNYMVVTRTVPLDHCQRIKTKYIKRFENFDDRVKFIMKDNWTFVGEVCLAIPVDNADIDCLAEKIVEGWKRSPSHNLGLLKDRPEGVYVAHQFANSLNTKVGTFHNDYVYCVLNTRLR